jgi:O-antigen ligase
MMYVFSAGCMLMVANHLSSLRQIKFMVWAYLILGTAFTIACWPWGIWGAETRLFGIGISGAVFWTLLAAFGFGQFFCNTDLPWKWRLAALVMVLNMLAFSWVRGRGWISGWLPPVAAIYVLVWLRSWKWGVAATLIGALALIPFSPTILAEFTNDDQSWSTYSRFLTWPILFELFKISPVFGLGLAHYHFYTIYYPIYGYYTYFNSHNNYWDLAVQTGVVGLALFLWLSAALVLLAFRIRRRAVDGFSRSFVDSIQAGFIAILASGMLADWFLPFVYNIGLSGFRNSILLWVFLGAMLSLDIILPPESAGAAPPATPAGSPVFDTRGTE